MLRPIIAISVLALVIFWAGPVEVWQTILSVDAPYFILLVLFSLPLIWASCLKWQLFLAARGHRLSILFLMRHYTISYFFNTFAPSFIGGDISRSLSVGNHVGSKRDAFLSTFLERFTGLLAMAILSVVFLNITEEIPTILAIFVWCIVSVSGLVALCLFHAGVANFLYPIFLKLSAKFGLSKIHGFSNKVFEGLDYVRGNRTLFWKSMLYSLLFHVLTVFNTYIAAQAIGWSDVALWQLFVVVPLVLLVSMIPITPGGIGLQEGAFAYFLAQIGATVSQGVGVGLVLRIKVLIIAVIGALLWAFYKKTDPEVAPSDGKARSS